jgi:hypothetical protein
MGRSVWKWSIYSKGNDTLCTIYWTRHCCYCRRKLSLSRTGTVLAMGYTQEGELGIPIDPDHDINFFFSPVTVSGLPQNIKSIHAGGAKSLVLTDDGKVYGWGALYYNLEGNLADNSHVLLPTMIEGILTGKNIIDVAAYNDHTLVLTDDGEIIGRGFNTNGQLGNGIFSSIYHTVIPFYPVLLNQKILGHTVTTLGSGGGSGASDYSVVVTSLSDVPMTTVKHSTTNAPSVPASSAVQQLTTKMPSSPSSTTNTPSNSGTPGQEQAGDNNSRLESDAVMFFISTTVLFTAVLIQFIV